MLSEKFRDGESLQFENFSFSVIGVYPEDHCILLETSGDLSGFPVKDQYELRGLLFRLQSSNARVIQLKLVTPSGQPRHSGHRHLASL